MTNRLVIDTNVYIDWIASGRHEEILFRPGTVKYLSAVVLMELRAGAFSRRDQRLVQRLQSTFERTGRIVEPSCTVFTRAGDTLRRLQADRGYNLPSRHSIVNDVLIALSARAIGATVVTQNGRDFRAIQSVAPFRLAVVS